MQRWLVMCLVALTATLAQGPKKLIATGWDNADTARLRANLAEMEQRPFDGTVIRASLGEGHGWVGATFSATPWEPAWLETAAADLKAITPRSFTDLFLWVGANPGNVDWFDDAGWQAVVEHWRLAARLAKQGNVRGLLFDPEPYTEPFRQFDVSAQPQRAEHTFAAYEAKARERGQEVMRAVAGEFPDLVLFCYFLNSVNAAIAAQPDPHGPLASSAYGLLPAFLNGWLDVAPPSVVMVDGCESAYRYNSKVEYLNAYHRIKGTCQRLVAPENRAKYRAQVQVSFGVYLDAYVNPPTSPWYIDPKGETPVARLRQNVEAALEVADEYVWAYGEKHRWWPTPNRGVNETDWPTALPGIDHVFGFARNPLAWATSRLAALGERPNLALNGDFGQATVTTLDGPVTYREGGLPAGWSFWQAAEGGRGEWDREAGCRAPGSGRLTKIGNGCLIQRLKVQPGERYLIRAQRRLEGQGQALIRVRWQTPDGKWFDETRDQFLVPRPGADWQPLEGVVQIPEQVGYLVVLLSASGQEAETDRVWYDDVEILSLD
ncbi:MAG: hypothetical protein HUU35_05035 [Armatimonadetes bacterium]|nr:hypothetical protein [Armatimonadota bacterium]